MIVPRLLRAAPLRPHPVLLSRPLSSPPGFHERFPCVEANAFPAAAEEAEAAEPSARQRELYQHFPCITRNPSSGPEPAYARNVTGYELFRHDRPLPLRYNGARLESFQLAYETWGRLNEDRSNAILLHCGLSASSHARSHAANPAKGWWEKFLRPGGPLDLSRFFVICSNNLGGCHGSTGPSSIDPSTGKPFATAFPMLSVEDMVRAQFHLLDHLGIDKVRGSRRLECRKLIHAPTSR